MNRFYILIPSAGENNFSFIANDWVTREVLGKQSSKLSRGRKLCLLFSALFLLLKIFPKEAIQILKLAEALKTFIEVLLTRVKTGNNLNNQKGNDRCVWFI